MFKWIIPLIINSVFLSSQYAHLPETHNVRIHQDVSLDIQEFLDTSITKLSSPLQVSLMDVKAFMQDVEVKRFQQLLYLECVVKGDIRCPFSTSFYDYLVVFMKSL